MATRSSTRPSPSGTSGKKGSSTSKHIPKPLRDLHTTLTLLNGIYTRNKNQHRRSIWWRHFSAYRKCIRDIIFHSTTTSTSTSTTTATSGLKPTTTTKFALPSTQEPALLNDAEKHFWAQKLVPKWYRSFSQLVADPQFAGIGMVLVASLARVVVELGIQFDDLEGSVDGGGEGIEAEGDGGGVEDEVADVVLDGEDLGEVIARD
ncbi:hypothetical protein K402DRAFT_421509 [Aulographum hederae CBS 113979]|uniref:RNase MRP protein 1 RNA binding domain-containing protein n=1 Tax=Aulographum hederae CBS 113979 TaxID=1176131 RepID=A0A6G1GYA9_9PEZI|nr:hypothetical protein K402DRAFT_421509 [Aulographum hederae CBS 113979]